ncbi:MAG TPA: hypothetical protein VFY93_14180 [Planctomycetota bacterium]|nr:hypothetical protein [Planctomycetota bacterium]
MNDFKITRRAPACAVSGKPFEPGDVIVSVIHEEPRGFVRRDVREENLASIPGEPFCVFRTKQPPPPPPAKRIDYELAQEFLDRMLREADPAREPILFVLTLLLARKRRVRILKTKRLPEGDLLEVSIPRAEEDEIVHVRAPRLTPEEEAHLQREMARLFNFDVGESPEPPPPDPLPS